MYKCDPTVESEFEIENGAETDYCEYMFTVKTRHMCPAGRRLGLASESIHQSPYEDDQKP